MGGDPGQISGTVERSPESTPAQWIWVFQATARCWLSLEQVSSRAHCIGYQRRFDLLRTWVCKPPSPGGFFLALTRSPRACCGNTTGISFGDSTARSSSAHRCHQALRECQRHNPDRHRPTLCGRQETSDALGAFPVRCSGCVISGAIRSEPLKTASMLVGAASKLCFTCSSESE